MNFPREISMSNRWQVSKDVSIGLPPNKVIQIPHTIIVARAILHEYNKHYPLAFFDEILYKLWIM